MEFILTHPDTGIKEILVIFDGVPYEADSDHLWWDEIIRLCLADDERALDLFPIRPVQKSSAEVAFEAYETAVTADPTEFEVSPLEYFPIIPPDEQARAEDEANLNRPPAASGTVEAVQREALYGVLRGSISALCEHMHELEEAIDCELEKSDFLEAVLKRYGEHAWNDIERDLEVFDEQSSR